jgi:hypothetical protein
VIRDSEDLVSRELATNERLLWSGGPQTGVRLRPADALMIPFSLFWGGFAFFFGPTPSFNSFAQSGWPGSRQKGPPAFEFVKDVRNVYGLIRTPQER